MEPLAPAASRETKVLDQVSTNITAEKRCRSSDHRAGYVSLIVALMVVVFGWGFTVDDAWIVSRVAEIGLESKAYSFNRGQPATDAVTPLGFAHLLAALGGVFHRTSALELWGIARILGVTCFLVSSALSGLLVAREQPSERWWLGPALLILCAPAGAWAGAGLSTSIVGLLVLMGTALVEERSVLLGCGFLGGAVAWRPELAPFVGTLVCLRVPWKKYDWLSRARGGLALLAIPFLVMGMRWALFGRLVPLAAVAKPADLGSGIFYASMTMVWGGLSWLLVMRDGAWRQRWAVPWLVHLAALVYAGGDWMPALRLSVPLMPWMLWTVGRGLQFRKPVLVALVPAVGFSAWLAMAQGSDWRSVAERRLALVEAGRPHLEGARRVATVDIGWVGLATDASVIDLAGVTDPRVAKLPGGHTTKRVSPGFFSDREVDTWVIRALDRSYEPGQPLEMVIVAYLVDARLLRRNADLGFVGVATIPLQGTEGQYVIARRVQLADARWSIQERSLDVVADGVSEETHPQMQLAIGFIPNDGMSSASTR